MGFWLRSGFNFKELKVVFGFLPVWSLTQSRREVHLSLFVACQKAARVNEHWGVAVQIMPSWNGKASEMDKIKREKQNWGLVNFVCQNSVKSVQCLACVARVGWALHGVCQALASWLVNETGISCRDFMQGCQTGGWTRVCSEIWCKRCYCATCKSDTKPRKAHGQMWPCILVYFSGYTDESETEVSVGGRKAGKWECRVHVAACTISQGPCVHSCVSSVQKGRGVSGDENWGTHGDGQTVPGAKTQYCGKKQPEVEDFQ